MKTRIQNGIFIDQPIEKVFDTVTTIGHWPKWVPDTVEVFGQTDEPAQQGDEFTEKVKTLGFARGTVSWRVVGCERPNRWSMESTSIDLPLLNPLGGRNLKITVAYLLTSEGSGTKFERTFSYDSPTLLFEIANRLHVKKAMETLATRMFDNLRNGPFGGVSGWEPSRSPS